MSSPQVVTQAEWESARAELLVKEKEATRARDALAAERHRLPMVEVEKSHLGHLAHLHARDTSLVLASAAPVPDIERFRSFLDLTPRGRQEQWEDSPAGYPQDPPYSWWRLHDEYGRFETDPDRG